MPEQGISNVGVAVAFVRLPLFRSTAGSTFATSSLLFGGLTTATCSRHPQPALLSSPSAGLAASRLRHLATAGRRPESYA
jgi:hypothetical protein